MVSDLRLASQRTGNLRLNVLLAPEKKEPTLNRLARRQMPEVKQSEAVGRAPRASLPAMD